MVNTTIEQYENISTSTVVETSIITEIINDAVTPTSVTEAVNSMPTVNITESTAATTTVIEKVTLIEELAVEEPPRAV